MEPIGHLTQYDGLNKLCVGILLLAWIPFVYDLSCVDSLTSAQKFVTGLVFAIVSYIVGNLWHHVFTEKVFKCMVNNRKYIKKAYAQVTGDYLDGEKTQGRYDKYFDAYYRCEKDNLLGTVHILEATEAFIRNTLVILPFYVFGILYSIYYGVNDTQINFFLLLLFFFIAIIIGVVWGLLRNKLQLSIHELIWEADYYCHREYYNQDEQD